jgi:hypothetical protein
MINFDIIGSGNIVDTVLPPREIFNALPTKNAHKFQYPRDVQSQVWNKWSERRNDGSLVIKMNTGSGKTVVGLLILKSCLNENKSPAVYVCPDNYLVRQVLGAAKELGVEVTNDEKSPRFLSGKAILVTNVYKVVNGRSVFGVGDEGCKLRISSLIIDDAHACLDTVEDQFTVNIPRSSKAYDEFYSIFQDSLHAECPSKALEIESGDPINYIQIPYWSWQKNISAVSKILVNNKEQEYLKFVWPLIKEQLKQSHCVISADRIEISPHIIPIHMIPSILDADRKIFMTATLSDDSILSSHFSVDKEDIKTPIVPESAGDVGDRMILLPQVINPEINDIDIKSYAKQLSQNINVVVIVPSAYRAGHWRDVADLILTTETLYQGVEQLKTGHVGLTVLVNRYDGIDLPGDACRLLIIDGIPDVRKKIDKVKQGILMGSDRNVNHIIQRIEQGMGRGVRSNDDYCGIFLVGRNLTSQLYSQGAREKLSPATKAQLDLSDQLSEQIKGTSISGLNDTLNHCLDRNPSWVSTSKGILATLKYSETSNIDELTIALRNAYDLTSKNAPRKATQILLDSISSLKDKKEQGYVKQLVAEHINFYDEVEAQKLQLSAVNDNRRVLKPIEGIQYHKIASEDIDQAVACSNFITSKYEDPNKLIIDIKSILDNLKFKTNSANNFEESFKNIALYLGFDSQRPEQEYSKGPDVLWKLTGQNYFVIECKNEAVVTTISKTYCNQLNGSCNWFTAKYGQTGCNYTPILIHPSRIFEYASSPNKKIKVITKEKLEKFCSAVNSFISSIATGNELSNQEVIRQKIIANKLRSNDFIDQYTDFHTVRNQP